MIKSSNFRRFLWWKS